MLRIRPASLADAPALARVHVASWRAAYHGLMPDAVLAGLSEETFTENWQRRLTQMPRSTLLAVAADEVIGFAAAGPSRDTDAIRPRTGELYALYVHPEHWGSGTAQRLWRGMHQWLIVEEFAAVTLWVLEGNARARAFYESVGFEQEPGAIKSITREGAVLPEMRYRMPLA